jgi:hypothetical protein
MTRKLEVVWSLGVTGSFLVIWSYWKFSGHGELLEVFWSFGVTGSFLDIGSYWELSCDWELLEIVWVTPNDQKTSSNSL